MPRRGRSGPRGPLSGRGVNRCSIDRIVDHVCVRVPVGHPPLGNLAQPQRHVDHTCAAAQERAQPPQLGRVPGQRSQASPAAMIAVEGGVHGFVAVHPGHQWVTAGQLAGHVEGRSARVGRVEGDDVRPERLDFATQASGLHAQDGHALERFTSVATCRCLAEHLHVTAGLPVKNGARVDEGTSVRRSLGRVDLGKDGNAHALSPAPWVEAAQPNIERKIQADLFYRPVSWGGVVTSTVAQISAVFLGSGGRLCRRERMVEFTDGSFSQCLLGHLSCLLELVSDSMPSNHSCM